MAERPSVMVPAGQEASSKQEVPENWPSCRCGSWSPSLCFLLLFLPESSSRCGGPSRWSVELSSSARAPLSPSCRSWERSEGSRVEPLQSAVFGLSLRYTEANMKSQWNKFYLTFHHEAENDAEEVKRAVGQKLGQKLSFFSLFYALFYQLPLKPATLQKQNWINEFSMIKSRVISDGRRFHPQNCCHSRLLDCSSTRNVSTLTAATFFLCKAFWTISSKCLRTTTSWWQLEKESFTLELWKNRNSLFLFPNFF